MTYYKSRNLKVAGQKKDSGKVSLCLVMLFSMLLLSIVYLAQANNIVARNFELRAAQNNLKELENKNQELLVSLMQARSLPNLENAAKDLNLVSVEKVNYMKTLTGFFAMSQ